MRFACQSCGKAYNLPEEKIADKSNVKLKCRVCGAIVEVKRQGDVVAQMLGDTDAKRSRVSEAPAPLTSMSPDDGEDATHAIAVGDQILSESGSTDDEAAAAALLGHVRSALGQRSAGAFPPPSPTGFGSPSTNAFGAPSTGFSPPSPPGFSPASPPGFNPPSPPGFSPPSPPSFPPSAAMGPTPVPPPLSMPDLPRSEPNSPFRSPEPPQFPSTVFGSGPGSPPPPLPSVGGAELGHAGYQPNGSLQHANNGMSPRFGEGAPLSDEPLPGLQAPGMASMNTGTMSVSASGTFEAVGFSGASALDVQQVPASNGDTTRKMLAALATGILIGFIIARLFF